jgi:RNA polymerase sigma-70 factor (ECF subfamily)
MAVAVRSDDAESDLLDVLAGLRAGDEATARRVFYRYARALIEVAGRNLGARLRQKLDPEDVVQSVFLSFFARCREDVWQFRDWNGLWELLVVITLRKCANFAAFYRAGRRTGDREAPLPAEPPTPEPTPDEAAELTDQLTALFARFDERGRQVLTHVFQGFTAAETAERIGCSERTVQRTLDRARRRLRAAGEAAHASRPVTDGV